MRFPGDCETEQIGKLIENGETALAGKLLASRQRHTTARYALWIIATIGVPLIIHFAR